MAVEPIGGVCTNCGAGRSGSYCSACGQHAPEGGRLTPRILWREFNQRFLHLEHGLFLTVREMTTDPGGLIGRYLAGQRRRYVNPLGFLVMAVAFNLVVHAFSGYEDRARSQMIAADQSAEFGMGFDQAMRAFMRWSLDHLSFLSVVICVFFAGFLRLFLGRERINMAEGLVFGLFCYAQMTIAGTLLEIPYIFFPDLPYSLRAETAFDFLLLFGLVFYAARGLFRKAAPTALTLLALAGGWLAYAALQVVAMVVFVVVVILSGGERDWTLHEAVARDRAGIVERLLDDGADPDAVRSGEEATALMLAAEKRRSGPRYVALLLEAGADPTIRNPEGRTALDLAAHPDARALLEAAMER